jgi:hypothetical protein
LLITPKFTHPKQYEHLPFRAEASLVDKENDGRVHIPWLKISEWADIYNGKDLFLGSLTNFALNESRYESTKMWMNAARDHLIWQRNNLKPFGM